MAEIKVPKVEKNPTKIRNVPIAVTPEGFWCCPSPVGFQKSVKPQNPQNKPKTSSSPAPKSSSQKKPTSEAVKKPISTASKPPQVWVEQLPPPDDALVINGSAETARASEPKVENKPRKVSIEFGESGTSDLKLILLGKNGFTVKLSVHRSTLMEKSGFFAKKISEEQLIFPCMEIDDCEDVEVYVDTVGLMYCTELKQRLKKQNVARILSILKVAEQLGYTSCVESCLEYLEAVPWVGEDEEQKVINSVLSLQSEGIGVSPVLKRVSSNIANPPHDTLSHVLELVLKSNEERARREIKSVVLKLLRGNSSSPSCSGSGDNSYDIIYGSCRSCLNVLLTLFREAADPDMNNSSNDCKESIMKHAVLQADNLSWLLEILADRRAADEFAMLWSSQQELALLHAKLPLASRYHVSSITARLFVGIGRGELLPSKDIKHLLLQTWFQPLINDYSWLQHGCRSFDRKVVEEGIGRTILTLPLQDQQSILLTWLGSFLKAGDNCPNLQRAFEVWWRRTFVRPYVDTGSLQQSESLMTSNIVE
ncbi:hypothetical protein Leryth_002571 [Lithospermum erythrorhizon]|nr:hypothetical protein Leryth_002571 [Lithospermum erythrorhizon]